MTDDYADGCVLVVDDDPDSRRVTVAQLRGLPAPIIEEAVGAEVLNRTDAGPVDLIVLASGLPDDSGPEICRRLRARPATAAIPIILLTRDDHDSQWGALEAGATDFVARPVRRNELYVRARNLLALARSQRRRLRAAAEREAEKTRALRERFERYLAPEIVERVLQAGAAGGGTLLEHNYRCHATALFADMRGFSAISERLEPEQVVALLNEFFEPLVATARSHGGTVISMAGDNLLVGFGVLGGQGDRVEQAILAAVAMRDAIARRVGDWNARYAVFTGVGIALSRGDVVAGNVGAFEFMSFTLIGEPVNVAARMSKQCRAGEILLTGSLAGVARRLGLAVKPLARVSAHGLQSADVHCVYTEPERPRGRGHHAADA